MTTIIRRLFCICAAFATLTPFARAGSEEANLECLRAVRAFASENPPSGRFYAPDRVVQVLHLAIDVTPDFKDRSIEGKTIIRFNPT